jgi:hypothetical protein
VPTIGALAWRRTARSAPRGAIAYWGYGSLSFFAPDRRYAFGRSPGGPTREVREMVRAFHAAGIEVYLDVVWRGIDNAAYYELSEDRQGYANQAAGATPARPRRSRRLLPARLPPMGHATPTQIGTASPISKIIRTIRSILAVSREHDPTFGVEKREVDLSIQVGRGAVSPSGIGSKKICCRLRHAVGKRTETRSLQANTSHATRSSTCWIYRVSRNFRRRSLARSLHSNPEMNALKLLKEQHEEVTNLFELIEQAEDEEKKRALVQEVADALAAHAAMEEEIFYPAAYASSTEDPLKEAVEEHLAMKRTLADIIELPVEDEQFDAKVKVLKEQVEHHVEEEEGELFKAVRAELEDEDLDRLGLEMKARFDELMSGEPSERVFSETDEAAHLPR